MADPPAIESPDDDFSLGRIGPWLIGRKLEGGGQGTIHLVRHGETGKLGAAKLVRFGYGLASSLKVRFDREVGALRRLDHPNIVRMLDSSPLYTEEPWMVMEFVEGVRLATLAPKRQKAAEDTPQAKGRLPWEREPLPARRIAVIAGRIARAMGAAHGQNILHRDLKCENVMMRADGEPVIVDFGLALHPKDESVTMTGFALGTPVACAPEVLLGLDNSTQLSDIFSIGVILYHLLTGDYPWGASSNAAALRKLIDERKGVPTPMRTHVDKVDRELEAICLKCLELEPDRRFSSCVALAEELERWLEGLPTLTRPPGAAGRLWKWVRRNPLPAALVAASFLGATGYVVQLIRENKQLGIQALEAAQARQREAQRLVWEAFSARQRRDKEGMDRALDRFREIIPDTEGWGTVEGILEGLLDPQAIRVPGITCLASDPTGRKAAGRADGVIQVFDSRGSLLREVLPPRGTKGKVTSLVFTPSGDLLRAAEGGGMHFIQLDHPEMRARWLAASAETLIAAGPHVIACGAASGGGDVIILDAATGAIVRVLPEAGYLAAAGGDRLATATTDGVITVWDASGRVPVLRFTAGGAVTALAVCGGGQWVAWADESEAAVYLKDLRQPQLPPRVLAGADSTVKVLAGAGDELAAGCASGSVIFWNPGTGSKSRQSTVSHVRGVSHIVWPAGMDAPVTAGMDEMIRIHPRAVDGPAGLWHWAAEAPVAWNTGTGIVWRNVRGQPPTGHALPDAESRICLGTGLDGSGLCTIRTSGQEIWLEWLHIRGDALQTGVSIRLDLPDEGRSLWSLEGGRHLGRLTPRGVRVMDAKTGAAAWTQTFGEIQDPAIPQGGFLLSADGSCAAWRWREGRTWLAGKNRQTRSIDGVSALCPRPGSSSEFAAGLIDGRCGFLDVSTGGWTSAPVKLMDGPVRSLALAADGHTLAVGGHLARDGSGGGLTLIDLRQLAHAGSPAFLFTGQQIASLAFTGTSTLGFASADGTISFAGGHQPAEVARAVRGQPLLATTKISRLEWVVSPDALPLLPSSSLRERLGMRLGLGQPTPPGLAPGVWLHTFAGLPLQVRSGRLILRVSGSPDVPPSRCDVLLGAQKSQGRWLPQISLSATPPAQGKQDIGLDLDPQLIAGAQGTLECVVSSAAPLTEMTLVIEPKGECVLAEGARKSGETMIFDASSERGPALTDLLPGQRVVHFLQHAALWSAEGNAMLSPGQGLLRLPADAKEFSCTFDLPDEPAGMQVGLWLEFSARGLLADLNGVRIPRPDAAPMAGRRHFIESRQPGLLKRGKNTLKFMVGPARQAITVKITGGIIQTDPTVN